MFSIQLDGENIDSSIRKSILQVSCDLQLTLANEITLAIHDPNFKISNSDVFKLGADLELSIECGTQFKPVMLGQVISLEPELSENSPMILIVRAYDKSFMLRRTKTARPAFLNMRHSEIVSQIVQEAGLLADVATTPVIYDYVQQIESDWRFLKKMALANGYELYIFFDTVVFKPSNDTSTSTHSIKRGRELLNLSLRLSGAGQPNTHVVRGWDAGQKQPLVARTTPGSFTFSPPDKRLGAEITSEVFGECRSVTFDPPMISQNEAEHLAEAQFQSKARSFVTGNGWCLGNPEMKAGDNIELLNMGGRFSGLYYLTDVSHIISNEGYRTRFCIERNFV